MCGWALMANCGEAAGADGCCGDATGLCVHNVGGGDKTKSVLGVKPPHEQRGAKLECVTPTHQAGVLLFLHQCTPVCVCCVSCNSMNKH